MPKVNIKTRLGSVNEVVYSPVGKYIMRGGTTIFDFDLSQKAYTLTDISQITFIFQQGNNIWKFNAFKAETDHQLESHMALDIDNLLLSFTMEPNITSQFVETYLDSGSYEDFIKYEIVVELNMNIGADVQDAILIEPQYLIGVKNSIYAGTLK